MEGEGGVGEGEGEGVSIGPGGWRLCLSPCRNCTRGVREDDEDEEEDVEVGGGQEVGG